MRGYEHRPSFVDRDCKPNRRVCEFDPATGITTIYRGEVDNRTPIERIQPDYETQRRERTQGAGLTVLIIVALSAAYAVLAWMIGGSR